MKKILFPNNFNIKCYMSLPFNTELEDRQKIIGNYIIDFFCAEKDVVIEADGASRQGREEYDPRRDDYLRALGLTVIRILATYQGPPRPSGTPPKEGNSNPLKRDNNPLKRDNNPLERNSNPLERNSNPLKRNSNPLKRNNNPLERNV